MYVNTPMRFETIIKYIYPIKVDMTECMDRYVHLLVDLLCPLYFNVTLLNNKSWEIFLQKIRFQFRNRIFSKISPNICLVLERNVCVKNNIMCHTYCAI